MTGPREPEDYGFKPPMTARRETKPTSTVERLVSRATLSNAAACESAAFLFKGFGSARPAGAFGGGWDAPGDGQGAGRANDAGRQDGADDPRTLCGHDTSAE